jgi:hypothetical protein
VVQAAMDFGCLPDDVEARLTDEQFHVWLIIKDEEARAVKKASRG